MKSPHGYKREGQSKKSMVSWFVNGPEFIVHFYIMKLSNLYMNSTHLIQKNFVKNVLSIETNVRILGKNTSLSLKIQKQVSLKNLYFFLFNVEKYELNIFVFSHIREKKISNTKFREIDSFHFTSFLVWTFFQIYWPIVNH